MEKMLNKLERKYGKYAIERLSLYLILAYVIGYTLQFSGSLDFLRLNPYEIANGQIWRIVTWVIVPPERFSIFTIIMLFLYYSLGTTLERTWGTFRYNVYIFSGMIFTLIGAALLYVVLVCVLGLDGAFIGRNVALCVSTYYINMSIFLAFAATYPDMQLLLYFIIPIKIKWLGILYGVLLFFDMIQGNIFVRVIIAMSLLNFVIFYLSTRNLHGGYRKAKWTKGFSFGNASTTTNTQRNEYNNQRRANPSITKHRCAICGQTEKDNSELEFRFCSKCNGNYEYCNVHLFTHIHKQ